MVRPTQLQLPVDVLPDVNHFVLERAENFIRKAKMAGAERTIPRMRERPYLPARRACGDSSAPAAREACHATIDG